MEHSAAYNWGLTLGLLTGAAVGVVIVWLLFKKRILNNTFDERQELARGKAFQYAYYTLLVAVFAYGLSTYIVGRWIDLLTGLTLCMCISVAVFAIVCIRKNAYLSLKERPKQIMALFAVLSVFNLGIGLIYYMNGSLVEDGVLSFRACNPLVGVLTVIVMIVYAAEQALSRRESEEE